MTEHKINVKSMALGRAASEVAKVIIGKDSANYAPNRLSDNKVLVQNIESIKITGRKLAQKRYYRHSGYIGKLKSKSLDELYSADVKKVFTKTVRGMLPQNRLGDQMIKKMRFE